MLFLATDLSPFAKLNTWPDVQAVIAVENIASRTRGDGKVTTELAI